MKRFLIIKAAAFGLLAIVSGIAQAHPGHEGMGTGHAFEHLLIAFALATAIYQSVLYFRKFSAFKKLDILIRQIRVKK